MTVDAMLRLEREIPAEPEKVYDAWVTPETMMRWWGHPGFTIPDCQVDATVGGKWAITMVSPEGNEMVIAGAYKLLERPKRIVTSWAWRQEDGGFGHESEVDISFAPSRTGTLITLVHKHFETTDRRDAHRRGWTVNLDNLERYFIG